MDDFSGTVVRVSPPQSKTHAKGLSCSGKSSSRGQIQGLDGVTCFLLGVWIRQMRNRLHSDLETVRKDPAAIGLAQAGEFLALK